MARGGVPFGRSVFVFVIGLAALAAALSCSPSTVQLQPVGQGGRSEGPLGGPPAKPDPGSNPGGGGGTDPGDPSQPSEPRPARYFLFCAYNSGGDATSTFDMTLMAASLGPSDHGQRAFFVDWSFPENTPIRPRDHSVASQEPAPIARVAPYTIRTLFKGRRLNSQDAWKLYAADLNVALRAGRARPIGPYIEASAGARAAARAWGGQARKVAASSAGTYAFVPASTGSFDVLRSSDLVRVGRIDVGGDALMPRMDEASGIFWAWTFDGGSLTNRFFQISTEGGFRAASLGSSVGGGSQTPAQSAGNGLFAWAEAPEARAGLAPRMVGVSYEPRSRRVFRQGIGRAAGAGAFRTLASALRLPGGELGLVVVEEDVDRRYIPWQVRRAEIQIFALAESTAPARPYGATSLPQAVLNQIEFDNPMRMHHETFAALEATSLPDLKQVVLTMETIVGAQLFRVLGLESGGVVADGLSLEVCQQPLGIENLD